MPAGWMVARSELRRRWRSTLLIALTVALVGGIVLATVAGARRSMTALSRLQLQTRASTVEVDVGGASPAQLAAFEQQRGVVAVARPVVYAQQVDQYPDLQIAAATDERFATVVDCALNRAMPNRYRSRCCWRS